VPALAVELKEVSRHFGSVKAVDAVSVEIADGEFFSMLGPSGSGKTTCLRLIAGFELPSGGRILLDGRDASALPPYERDVNTVFQDYALFPHMSVQENVEYGLRVKGVPRAERETRATDALAMVALTGFGARRPGELSGGQRQRVALARALVNRPRVLLLDEPLGALDLKLREQMQGELKALQRRLKMTFIYVTHDQGEALSMSDRVAVFDHGRIVQVDTPQALYERPRNAFVAGFVGAANVVSGELARLLSGKEGTYSVRPEHIRFGAPSGDDGSARGEILDVSYQGALSRYDVALAGGKLGVVAPNSGGERPKRGDEVQLAWSRSALVALES
jgi:putative spermidine/putrescine transport system ATP-binding protein